MLKAPVSKWEKRRLATLYDYSILDTGPERDFDDLVRLAAGICNVPIALISLIDSDRQWFKAKVGTDACESPREVSFCGHAIVRDGLFIVNDAQTDARFADNPFVVSDPHIRFYAGSPLVGPEGHAFGTLCVIDRVPRTLRQDQYDALEMLGRQAVNQMRLRKAGMSLRAEAKFARATIDAIPSSIATLETSGEIISLNAIWARHHERWSPFNGCGVGDDYLLVCDRDVNLADSSEPSLSASLKRILSGVSHVELTRYSLDVSGEKRWFNFPANRFSSDGLTRVTVVHDDVTQANRTDNPEFDLARN